MSFACRASILATLTLIISVPAVGCSGDDGEDNKGSGAGSTGSGGSAVQGSGGNSAGGTAGTTSGGGSKGGSGGNSAGGNNAGGASSGGNGGSTHNGGTGGGSGGTYTVQQGDPVQAADFPHAFAVALCAKKEECCALDGIETLPEDCVQQIEEFITTTYHDPLIAAGAPFDAEKAGDCIATLPLWTCGQQDLAEDFAAETFGSTQALFPDLGTPYSDLDICGAYGHGTLAVGAACERDSQCTQPDGTRSSCINTCSQEPTTKAGGECEGSYDCTAPLGCRNGVCAAPSGEGGPCDSNHDCDGATRCDLETFLCVPRKEEGATCKRDGDCVAPLQCSSLTSTGFCSAVVGLGEPCSDADDCAHGLWCSGDPDVDGSGDGTCQADFALGESCLDDSQCSDGYSCGIRSGSGLTEATCLSWLTCYVRY